MSHTVHGTLRKPPFVKQVQDSTMFVIELAEVVKDYKTGEKTYSNYKAMLFAKSPAAIEYYTSATAEGSFVVVSSEKLKVESREHNGKTYISLMLDNARLEGAKFEQAPQQAPQRPQAPQQPQQAYQQPQQAPQQPPQGQPMGVSQQGQQQAMQQPPQFDEDLPF